MIPGGERRLSPETAERRGPNPKQQSCALQMQALSDRFCGLAELIHQPHRRLLVAIGDVLRLPAPKRVRGSPFDSDGWPAREMGLQTW